MPNKKTIRRIEAAFGKPPDAHYFEGDIDRIKTYHLLQKESSADFCVDDTTWNDLSMDAVYKRINGTLSTSGEQCLYHMLRCPAKGESDDRERKETVRFFEEHPESRRRIQRILWSLGKNRNMRFKDAFSPSAAADKWGIATLALTALLILSGVAFLHSALFALPFLALLVVNPVYHAFRTHRMEGALASVNYAVAMIVAANRIRKLGNVALDKIASPMLEAAMRTRGIARLGGVSFVMNGDLATYINAFLHLNLISFDRLRRKLGNHQKDIERLHAHLGRLDASIAIASYRQSVSQHCIPVIDFSPAAPPSLTIRAAEHPLLTVSIANDAVLDGAMLLTGSNASGKSTYLKTVAINAILAQGVCTALAADYRSTSFQVYTSMAISDDVQAGESYFIAEIKSIKRIFDAVARGQRVLCAIDEVLRGTNTLERVAASCELLRSLAHANCVCFAATHDQELCAMLSPPYRLYHFQERIEKDDVCFDYRLREGPATTKNAIALLALVGFEHGIIAGAKERIAAYEATGNWGKPTDSVHS